MNKWCVGVSFIACLASGILPAGAAPLRELVYHFSYESSGFGQGAAMGGPFGGVVNEIGGMGSAARDGKITVDVVSATQDGGLVVDIGEQIDRRTRPLQTVRCAVYGDTIDVICDQNVGATAEETVLLDYVGRAFYDESKLDAGHHWQTTPRLKGRWSLVYDFTVTGKDGDALNIAMDGHYKRGAMEATSTGTILYDAAMNIPRKVHLSNTAGGSATFGDTSVDLSLLSDSMAQTKAVNSH